MERREITRWVVGILCGLAIVALLVWADRQSGVDDRDTDPVDVMTSALIDLRTDAAPSDGV